MAADTGRTISKLKEMVDRDSLNYLTDEPYKVFKELIGSDAADKKTAGAILLFLVTGMQARVSEDCSFEELSKDIQKRCCLNKKMSDTLAAIFLSLYSLQNREEWKNNELKGLEAFKAEDFGCSWEGFAVWDAGSVSIDCHYNANIVLMPTDSLVIDKELATKLKKNPFTTKEAVCDHYRAKLIEKLDSDFDYYCTCEEYYEPVVEDFEIEDYVRDWCEENGFELIDCEGDGHDDGYEPKHVFGFY